MKRGNRADFSLKAFLPYAREKTTAGTVPWNEEKRHAPPFFMK
jgi:hypothetical protein